MKKKSLPEWLVYIQSLHGVEMDLSVERVEKVAKSLNLLNPPCSVITVAGTNGKGSTVAGLEAIYSAAGYRTGAFSSPALFRHNEQVRVSTKEVDDHLFCQAFEKIEEARGDTGLTQFELNTLAAFFIFKQHPLDVWILEVGLGGRWDAVNVIDADVAVITSIGIDHVEWLGDTREKIAFEKAGIFRQGRPVVCGDSDPPETLLDCAKTLASPFFCQGRQFGFEKRNSLWDWYSETVQWKNLPMPRLALQNMSTVLMTIELLQEKLPVTRQKIETALATVSLPGRIQVMPNNILFDVSHNPASAAFLADWLRENKIKGKTRAVFSMLADKDIVETIQVIRTEIDDWYVAPLTVKRASSSETLFACFQRAGIAINLFSHITQAFDAAFHNQEEKDRLVVFGSFHTVADVSKRLEDKEAIGSFVS